MTKSAACGDCLQKLRLGCRHGCCERRRAGFEGVGRCECGVNDCGCRGDRAQDGGLNGGWRREEGEEPAASIAALHGHRVSSPAPAAGRFCQASAVWCAFREGARGSCARPIQTARMHLQPQETRPASTSHKRQLSQQARNRKAHGRCGRRLKSADEGGQADAAAAPEAADTIDPNPRPTSSALSSPLLLLRTELRDAAMDRGSVGNSFEVGRSVARRVANTGQRRVPTNQIWSCIPHACCCAFALPPQHP